MPFTVSSHTTVGCKRSLEITITVCVQERVLNPSVVSPPTGTETTWEDENHLKLVDHDDNDNNNNNNNNNIFNPLKPELNPICYLLALLAHNFLHVSRIRVKSLTFRRLMSYIYIFIYGAPILDVSRSHTTTQHSR